MRLPGRRGRREPAERVTKPGPGHRGRTRADVPFALLVAVFVLTAIVVVRERYEEIPRTPHAFGDYLGLSPADLGTEGLFSDTSDLLVRIEARRRGRVTFVVAGDGGNVEDPGKRELAAGMRTLCVGRCDFILLLGDNFYSSGIDTFGETATAVGGDSVDLNSDFLANRDSVQARTLAARARSAISQVARACAGGPPGGADIPGEESPQAGGRAADDSLLAGESLTAGDSAARDSMAAAVSAALDSGAARARRDHFEPRFERSFAWAFEDETPVFSVLGNHDARSPFGAECEIGYSLAQGTSWRLPFYRYVVEVTDRGADAPLLRLIALHSTAAHGTTGGENRVELGARQDRWLRRVLGRPPARWLAVASHHPVWTAGSHVMTEYGRFAADLLARFREAAVAPDLLLGGHNHWLESVQVRVAGRPALQIVSGSLSKVTFWPLVRGYPFLDLIGLDPRWRNAMREQLDTDPLAFLAADRSVLARGFAFVELEKDEARVRFFGVRGELYEETFVRETGGGAADGGERSRFSGRSR